MLNNSESSTGNVSPSRKTVTDDALWNSLRTGNEMALFILYKRHVHDLYGYGMDICRGHDRVMECLRTFFEKLWKDHNILSPAQPVKIFIYKSFREELFRQFSDQEISFTARQGDISFNKSDLQEQLSFLKTNDAENGILPLTEEYREILFLKFHAKLNYCQIAEITSIPVDSVLGLLEQVINLVQKKQIHKDSDHTHFGENLSATRSPAVDITLGQAYQRSDH